MNRQVLLLALDNLQTTVKVLSQEVFGLTMNSEVPRNGLLDSQTVITSLICLKYKVLFSFLK